MKRLTGGRVGPVRPILIEAQWWIHSRPRWILRRYSPWEVFLFTAVGIGLGGVASTMSVNGFFTVAAIVLVWAAWPVKREH